MGRVSCHASMRSPVQSFGGFDWTFTRNDLKQVLAKIADREPDLRLAA